MHHLCAYEQALESGYVGYLWITYPMPGNALNAGYAEITVPALSGPPRWARETKHRSSREIGAVLEVLTKEQCCAGPKTSPR